LSRDFSTTARWSKQLRGKARKRRRSFQKCFYHGDLSNHQETITTDKRLLKFGAVAITASFATAHFFKIKHSNYEEKMNKRILVISNKNSLTWGLYNEICRNESIELITEPSGSNAHKSIKEKKPDLVIVDLETPELGKSWVSIQLAGIDLKDQIPTVALSRLLNHEEREILSDLTGVPIHSSKARMDQFARCVEAS